MKGAIIVADLQGVEPQDVVPAVRVGSQVETVVEVAVVKTVDPG